MGIKNFTLCVLLAPVTFAYADTISVQQIGNINNQIVRTPVRFDSVNVKKEKFDSYSLLKTNLNGDKETKETISADSAGYFKLSKPEENSLMSINRFFVRSDRFTKVNIEITTPGKIEIYSGGKKLADKTSVQDSLPAAKTAKASFDMEPGQKEIIVKYLAEKKDNNPAFRINIIPADTLANVSYTLDKSHPLTIEDLMIGERISSASISPNGDYVIVNGSTVFPDGKRESSKKLYDVKKGVYVADLTSKEGLGWLPVSNRYFYTKKGLKGKTLCTVNPENGQEETVATNLPSGRFSWTPDETTLIFSVTEEPEIKKSDVQRLLSPDDRISGWRSRNSLYTYNLADGLFERITFGNKNIYLNDIRKDGKAILVSENYDVFDKHPFNYASFYQIDLNTLKVDTILTETADISSISYSPDGNNLLVMGSGEAFGGIGEKINEGQTTNLFDKQAFIYNLKDGKVTPFTKDFNPSVDNVQWNKNDNLIYISCTEKDYNNIYTYSPKTGKINKVNLNVDIVSSFSNAEKSGNSVYTGVNASTPEAVYLYNRKTGKSSLIEAARADVAPDYELGEVKDWNFVAQDGSTIDGRYYLPADFDPSKKYPMLVYYYGGTSPTARNFFHPYSMHLYAAQGYVVYVVQPSGTIGYGQEFAARHVNAWGKQTADDIIEGVTKFCEEHPFVNKEKIGCFGASYGGFMTMYLQTRTDIFAAAVSHAGISALSSYWGEGFWGYTYSAIASANSYPWNNKELYVEQSPLFNADKINTPLLLLHGKADTNVPVGESIQMYNALKILGKEVELIQVTDENHGIAGFDRRLAWKKSIMAFFAKHLKDQPQWWNNMYPEQVIE